LTSGHARAILAIEDKVLQTKVANEVISKNLNVRDTEKLVKKYLSNKGKPSKLKFKNENLLEIEEKLKNIFGTKVQLLSNNKKGKILIEYYSNEELDRILELVDTMAK